MNHQQSTTENRQTRQNPVSSPTVRSIRLNSDEKSCARKDTSDKRKEVLKSLEADARAFVNGFQTARAVNEEAQVLHRKFKDVVTKMRPVFERVREGFAHLKKGETIMGERTAEAWATKYIGVSYDWLCRCLNPRKTKTLLLTDGSKVLAPSAAQTDESPEGQLKGRGAKQPSTPTSDWTDEKFVRECVRLVTSTLRPLESDPQRFMRVVKAVANEILGDMNSDAVQGVEVTDLSVVAQ